MEIEEDEQRITTIELISSDNKRFVLSKHAACLSVLIRTSIEQGTQNIQIFKISLFCSILTSF